MFLANFISTAIILGVFFSILEKFHTRRANKDVYAIILILFFSVCTAIVNQSDIPILNLVITLLSWGSISVIFFKHPKIKDYLIDFINFFIVIFLDGLFFFVHKSFLNSGDAITEFVQIFQSLIVALVFIIVSYIINKLVDLKRIGQVPLREMFLLMTVFILHIVLIFIIDMKIELFNDTFSKVIIVATSIGMVITDFALIYYLDHVADKYELQKERIQETKEKQLKAQYYGNMKENFEQQKRIIHDFNNYVQVMSNAYENNNPTLAENVIDEVRQKYNTNSIIYTSSEILNIILYDKEKNAKDNNIDFICAIDQVDMSFISDFDMVTLFGNIIDNAIEANMKITDNRFIELKIVKSNSMLIITSKNNHDNTLIKVGDTIVSSKENHKGIGLKNIREIIEKYNGILDVEDKFGVFTMSIAIPIPDENI